MNEDLLDGLDAPLRSALMDMVAAYGEDATQETQLESVKVRFFGTEAPYRQCMSLLSTRVEAHACRAEPMLDRYGDDVDTEYTTGVHVVADSLLIFTCTEHYAADFMGTVERYADRSTFEAALAELADDDD